MSLDVNYTKLKCVLQTATTLEHILEMRSEGDITGKVVQQIR